MLVVEKRGSVSALQQPRSQSRVLPRPAITQAPADSPLSPHSLQATGPRLQRQPSPPPPPALHHHVTLNSSGTAFQLGYSPVIFDSSLTTTGSSDPL